MLCASRGAGAEPSHRTPYCIQHTIYTSTVQQTTRRVLCCVLYCTISRRRLYLYCIIRFEGSALTFCCRLVSYRIVSSPIPIPLDSTRLSIVRPSRRCSSHRIASQFNSIRFDSMTARAHPPPVRTSGRRAHESHAAPGGATETNGCSRSSAPPVIALCPARDWSHQVHEPVVPATELVAKLRPTRTERTRAPSASEADSSSSSYTLAAESVSRAQRTTNGAAAAVVKEVEVEGSEMTRGHSPDVSCGRPHAGHTGQRPQQQQQLVNCAQQSPQGPPCLEPPAEQLHGASSNNHSAAHADTRADADADSPPDSPLLMTPPLLPPRAMKSSTSAFQLSSTYECKCVSSFSLLFTCLRAFCDGSCLKYTAKIILVQGMSHSSLQ